MNLSVSTALPFWYVRKCALGDVKVRKYGCSEASEETVRTKRARRLLWHTVPHEPDHWNSERSKKEREGGGEGGTDIHNPTRGQRRRSNCRTNGYRKRHLTVKFSVKPRILQC